MNKLASSYNPNGYLTRQEALQAIVEAAKGSPLNEKPLKVAKPSKADKAPPRAS